MIAAKRHQEILACLSQEGAVRVTDLSHRFGVTAETIRRDLDRLEKDGKLLRTHGGAVASEEIDRDAPYWQREYIQEEEKRAIAREAVTRIKEGDLVLLDGSSTVWYLTQFLPDMPLTVLTNSVQVVTSLARHERIQVFFLGGSLLRESLSFAGPHAEEMLDQYYVQKVFISCKAVDLERGLTDVNELNASLRRKMIRAAREQYLLVDHSKFGDASLRVIADVRSVSEVITDARAAPAVIAALRQMQVKVTQAALAEE